MPCARPFGPESTGVLMIMSPPQYVMPGQMILGRTQPSPHFSSRYPGRPTSVGLYCRVPRRWFCCRKPLVSTVTFSSVDALIA